MFFRIFQHLLPNARAWRITANKQLRQFFEGLTGTGDDVKTYFDDIYNDIDPQKTRQLDEWENQFNLPNTGLTTQERRDRLEATWKLPGGQDPHYIQTTLQAAGFPVYVHEWWEPITSPNRPTGGSVNNDVTPVTRDPFAVLSDGTVGSFTAQDNDSDTQDNDQTAQDGASLTNVGYPLVNKIFIEISPGVFERKNYLIPVDPLKWPYFLYIGGQVFGTSVNIPQTRRDEFEDLCLKICPMEQWLGILVTYS